jgi:hypothetical protein
MSGEEVETGSHLADLERRVIGALFGHFAFEHQPIEIAALVHVVVRIGLVHMTLRLSHSTQSP